MIEDEILADKIVAHGVGSERSGYYSHLGSGFLAEKLQPAPAWFRKSNGLADKFVRDPRVAMAMMEKTIKDDRIDLRCVSGSWMPSLNRFDACVASSATPTYGVYLDRSNESLPRAINEATGEALND